MIDFNNARVHAVVVVFRYLTRYSIRDTHERQAAQIPVIRFSFLVHP